MNTSEVLNKAADLIEERGWMHGGGWRDEGDPGAMCLEGGILAATGLGVDLRHKEPFLTCPAYRAVQEYLGGGFRRLYDWNDADNRAPSEVIEVLRAAAVVEAARETTPALAAVSS